MKKTLKNIIAGVMLTTTVGMSGCFGAKAPTVKKVDINGIGINEYLVYDDFNASDYVLNVTMSDGSTKVVNIEEDMVVEKPDMTTAGNKKFKVQYEGTTYEISIEVGGYSNQDMIDKINAFLADYNAVSKAGNVKGGLDVEYNFRYLDKSASGSDSTVMEYPLNQSDIASTGDSLLKHLYSSIVGGLVKGSANITIDDIINSNELHSKVEILKVLEKIGVDLSEFNYLQYLLDEFIHSDGYVEFLNQAESIVRTYCALDDNANVKSFINNNFRDFVEFLGDVKDGKETTFKMYDVLSDFNTLIQNHCKDDILKVAIQEIVDSIDESDPYALSNIVKGIFDEQIIELGLYKQVYDDLTSYHYELVETEQSRIIVDKMQTSIADCIRSIEEIIVNIFAEEREDFSVLFDNLSLNIDHFVSCREDIANAELVSLDFRYVWDYLDEINANIKNQKDSETYLDFVLSAIRTNRVPNIIANCISDLLFVDYNENIVVTTSFTRIIENLMYDALEVADGNRFDVDPEDYIRELCHLLDIEYEGELYNQYLQEWTNTGFCSIFSDYLVEYIAEDTDDEVFDIAKQSCIELVRYLEDCLRTSGEKAKELTLENLFEKVHAMGIALRNSCEYHLNNNSYPDKTEMQAYYDIYNVIAIITDFSNDSTLRDNIDRVISEYRDIVKYILTNLASDTLGIERFIYEEINDGNDWQVEYGSLTNFTPNPLFEKAYNDMELLMDYVVDKYLKGQLDYKYLVDEYFKLLDKYGSEDAKIIANTMAINAMVIIGKDSDIDFNEVFDFIILPDEIESVDYNQLVQAFWDENTYKEMFKVSSVDVKYETDSQGNIAKEFMEVTFSFDYDLKITSIYASIKLNMEIEF